jgi:DNA-binding NarL/FixJ family response regulator
MTGKMASFLKRLNKRYMPSTVVASFNYETETKILRIVFTTGKAYDYKDVSAEVYEAMKSSFSKGEFFNKHIRNHFKFEKVELFRQ